MDLGSEGAVASEGKAGAGSSQATQHGKTGIFFANHVKTVLKTLSFYEFCILEEK